jgi:predicted TIM-barrel fold metal-dependent hydrolase
MDHAGGCSYGAWTSKDVAPGAALSPSEVLLRNLYFAVLDDRKTLELRDAIGVDHIMAEVDYPHADSTWPDSQQHFVEILGHLPIEEIRKITHENAAQLFRLPLPPDVRP